MKIPSQSMVSAAMALSSLQARDPIVFEDSFQTLTASSLSWIDSELLSQTTEKHRENDFFKKDTSTIKTSSAENEDHWHYHRVVAEALIRRKVFKVLDKYIEIASPERVEEALKYHTLPEQLKHELVNKYGGNPPTTWFDALGQLRDFCDNPETLWEQILDHPMTSYVPVQCQSCGDYVVPDDGNASASEDAKLGLTEEEPLPEEKPLVRTGWFRGPRMVPRVFVLDCPRCGSISRWFRSRDPRVILNPRRWGRLCGEQEDLRLDLANYLGFISIRTLIPLDWDHIWSEFRIIDSDIENNCDDQSSCWRLRDDDGNFAARLNEGIGSWTRILAVSPNPDFCRDVTNEYLSVTCQGGKASDHIMSDMQQHRLRVMKTREDHSGSSTQAGTVNGYAIHRAGLTSAEITLIMERAAKEYGRRKWYQVQHSGSK